MSNLPDHLTYIGNPAEADLGSIIQILVTNTDSYHRAQISLYVCICGLQNEYKFLKLHQSPRGSQVCMYGISPPPGPAPGNELLSSQEH